MDMRTETAKASLLAVKNGNATKESLNAFGEKELAIASFEMLRESDDFESLLPFLESMGLVGSVPVKSEAQ